LIGSIKDQYHYLFVSHVHVLYVELSLNTDCLQQLVTGFTKPGEVGEILALYQLKSPSLDCKAKLKAIKVALFLFASHSFLANNLRFMVN
jgi:hypothetical protein